MEFKSQLIKVQKQYTLEFEEILNFANSTERELTSRFNSKSPNKPNEKDRAEIKRIGQEILDIVEDNTTSNIINHTIETDSSFVANLIKEKLIPLKHRSFLIDMTLSYLISYQEAMFKDYLFVVLTNNTTCLKSNNKITYSELLDFSDFGELVASIADKEVEKIGRGSIDDIHKYFIEKFNIDLSDYDMWNEIVESTYRRNLIIHNKGIVNQVYLNRFFDAVIGDKPHIDIDYIVNASKNLIGLSTFIYSSLISKFKL
ncbi:TPA: hypothetical protein ACPJZQ_004113 [Vibrio alginolyticus]